MDGGFDPVITYLPPDTDCAQQKQRGSHFPEGQGKIFPGLQFKAASQTFSRGQHSSVRRRLDQNFLVRPEVQFDMTLPFSDKSLSERDNATREILNDRYHPRQISLLIAWHSTNRYWHSPESSSTFTMHSLTTRPACCGSVTSSRQYDFQCCFCEAGVQHFPYLPSMFSPYFTALTPPPDQCWHLLTH